MQHDGSESGGKIKVLIADDNEQNLYMLNIMLNAESYDVTSAWNGREALEYLKNEDYQLIISDILMPKMDGFQLCRECKADERLKRIPFIFYTATYTDKKDEDFALSLGADRFILKPAEPAVFMEVVRSVIDEYRSGAVAARDIRIENEQLYLAEHNERLIEKLESKMLELEQANKALKESEEKYRLLVNTASEAIVIVQDGVLKFVNPATGLLTGYSVEELSGLSFLELVHPDHREKIAGKFQKWVEGRISHKIYEFQGLDKTGKQLWVESISAPVTWEGKPAIICFIRDITEQKMLEYQLIQAQKLEALGTLAGGIAHDFNTLLTILLGCSEIMLMKMKENDPLKTYVEQIMAATDRASGLTRSLLAFSRKEPSVLKPVKLNELIKGSEKLLRRLLHRGVELRLELSHEEMVVMADAGQIDQILFNLVSNARDAVPGKGVLKIETKCADLDSESVTLQGFGKPGIYAVMIVSDTGHGMDQKTKEKIFDPFFTTKEQGKGTGLGLSTVYGIVKKHNGYISVDSEVGAGTTFSIYFPATANGTGRENRGRTAGLRA